ncbi:MAG: hypothetical protein ACRC5H_01115, partial [Treponemataceae bacterium]
IFISAISLWRFFLYFRLHTVKFNCTMCNDFIYSFLRYFPFFSLAITQITESELVELEILISSQSKIIETLQVKAKESEATLSELKKTLSSLQNSYTSLQILQNKQELLIKKQVKLSAKSEIENIKKIERLKTINKILIGVIASFLIILASVFFIKKFIL